GGPGGGTAHPLGAARRQGVQAVSEPHGCINGRVRRELVNAKAKERRRAAGNEELLPGRGERRPGFRPRWHAALPVLLALFIGVRPAPAQSAEPRRSGHRHTLRAGDYVADTFIPAMPRTYKNATPTAVFEVTYVDFPPGAQAAFQFAVDQWSWLVVSPVPI